jgi:hypothetical protein
VSDLALPKHLANRVDICARARHLRVDLQDFFKDRHSLLEIAELDEDEATAGQGAEMARLPFQRDRNVLQRLLKIVQKVVDRRTLVPAFGKGRRASDDLTNSVDRASAGTPPTETFRAVLRCSTPCRRQPEVHQHSWPQVQPGQRRCWCQC